MKYRADQRRNGSESLNLSAGVMTPSKTVSSNPNLNKNTMHTPQVYSNLQRTHFETNEDEDVASASV